jgi:hypothetical protein
MANLSNERISFELALANLLALYEIEGGSGTILATRLTLINYVKVKLDEIIPEGEGVQFSVEGDSNISDPLNIMVNSILNEAAKRVLLNAPIHVLDPVKSATAAGTQDAVDNKIGCIPLASNFLRLVSLKMADWTREVTSAISANDKRYSLQKNKYTRGGVTKPVVVFSFRTISSEQKRVLEYYSVDDSHNIDWLYYIQETEAEDLQSNLVDALTWMAAGMILQITERADLAKIAFEQEQMCYQNL